MSHRKLSFLSASIVLATVGAEPQTLVAFESQSHGSVFQTEASDPPTMLHDKPHLRYHIGLSKAADEMARELPVPRELGGKVIWVGSLWFASNRMTPA